MNPNKHKYNRPSTSSSQRRSLSSLIALTITIDHKSIPHSLHVDYLRRDLLTSHLTAFTLSPFSPHIYPHISRCSRRVVSISQPTSAVDRSVVSGANGRKGNNGNGTGSKMKKDGKMGQVGHTKTSVKREERVKMRGKLRGKQISNEE